MIAFCFYLSVLYNGPTFLCVRVSLCLFLTSSGTTLIFSVYLRTTSSGFLPCHRINHKRNKITIKDKPDLPLTYTHIPQVSTKEGRDWPLDGTCLSTEHKRITAWSWWMTNFHQFWRLLRPGHDCSLTFFSPDKRVWACMWREYACLWCWGGGGHLQTGT